MSKLIPQNGNVIIKPIEEQEQTYGNIVVPDMGKEKANIMVVISTSDTYNWHTGKYYESKLTPGQKVIVAPLGGSRVSMDGEDYFIYKETEILATLEDEVKFKLKKEHLGELLEDSQKQIEKGDKLF